ncbi:hypothetical protein LIER_09013 [Lithospermum erythrorhizon]|uniref:Uncharacterized protein n=1 Tax=Lithospermum erythrorhizon TaxID=34254 RepID=A0AAV3PE72_LITER
MSQLYNTNGEKMELESIKASFEGNVFLMLLHRTQGRDAENSRMLLLISYYEDSAPQGSSSMAWNSGALINTGTNSISNAKKLLTWTEQSTSHHDASDAENTDDGQNITIQFEG